MRIGTLLAAASVGVGLCLPARGPAASGHAVGRPAVLGQLAERFRAEIYPLLVRDSNGCKACHDERSARTFQVLGSPVSTFSLLLERDLFAPLDPMAIPGRVTSADAELRMPKAGTLSQAEIDRVRSFAADLAASLDRGESRAAAGPDERFPDSLLLPFDGEDRTERVQRRMSYFQLQRSYATLFGAAWLADSGADLFQHKAHALGGADFRSSFDPSRAVTASYLAAVQEIAREAARRYVSAPSSVLFDGFDPDVTVRSSPKAAARDVRALYQRILFFEPAREEIERALALVRELQGMREERRKARFTLTVRDSQGRQDRRQVDVTLRAAKASVSRYVLDQAQPETADTWVRVGQAPFRFEAGNPDHFVRLVARPGNHVTAFDAVKLVPVQSGTETAGAVVLDNLDPECTLAGDWEPVEKDGERSRAGEPKKKYELDLHVFGSNHLERRSVKNELGSVTVALRIPRDGQYNVYLSWPRIPRAATAALVEVHAAADSARPAIQTRGREPGFATVFLDQTESTLDPSGETQWQLVHREALLDGPDDYVEISNRGVDSTKSVIVADAVKFVALDGSREVVVDNASPEGFEASAGWAPDQLERNAPGRGKMFGDDILHYPPSKSGNPLADNEIDPGLRVWARYRPVDDGQYRPGWYSVYAWMPGGHTHADWVALDIRGSGYAPVAHVEAPPEFVVGEIAELDAGATYHPGGERAAYRWTHDASDLGLRIKDATSPTPSFRVPPLDSPRPGWAGLVEALLQRPEFLMPADGPDAPLATQLARVALDLAGRIPTREEFQRLEKDPRLEPLIDTYLASDDFRDFFFHRARAAFRSRGTLESDEPARLWTYIATNDRSYRELFTADYTVKPDWTRAARRPVHGPTGFLTMRGYMEGKPGLPKFTYPSQVLTFALGVQFEVSDAVEDARDKVVSTTDPKSMCYSCHRLLTPLAYQRERWDVHGHYREVDETHEPIDDSDRGVVPDYPFKGQGLGAFAAQVVRKEKFVRAFVNLHHDMLFHRRLRVYEDQRDEYRELFDFAVANDLRIRPLLKKMLLMRYDETQAGIRSRRVAALGPDPRAAHHGSARAGER